MAATSGAPAASAAVFWLKVIMWGGIALMVYLALNARFDDTARAHRQTEEMASAQSNPNDQAGSGPFIAAVSPSQHPAGVPETQQTREQDSTEPRLGLVTQQSASPGTVEEPPAAVEQAGAEELPSQQSGLIVAETKVAVEEHASAQPSAPQDTLPAAEQAHGTESQHPPVLAFGPRQAQEPVVKVASDQPVAEGVPQQDISPAPADEPVEAVVVEVLVAPPEDDVAQVASEMNAQEPVESVPETVVVQMEGRVAISLPAPDQPASARVPDSNPPESVAETTPAAPVVGEVNAVPPPQAKASPQPAPLLSPPPMKSMTLPPVAVAADMADAVPPGSEYLGSAEPARSVPVRPRQSPHALSRRPSMAHYGPGGYESPRAWYGGYPQGMPGGYGYPGGYGPGYQTPGGYGPAYTYPGYGMNPQYYGYRSQRGYYPGGYY